jgi:hypothetical protein
VSAMRSRFEPGDVNREGRPGRGQERGARRQTLRWSVSVAVVVAGLAVAFLYLHSMLMLSSVTAVVSTLTPTQDGPATTLAASPPDGPGSVSSALPTSASLAIAPAPGDDRREGRNSAATNQVAKARTGWTPTTSIEPEPGKEQEAVDMLHAELAKSGLTASEIQQFDAQVKAAEAQLKAARESLDAQPSRIDQRGGAVATDQSDGKARRRRRRH